MARAPGVPFAIVLCLAACGTDHRGGANHYRWDGSPIVCSRALDDLTRNVGLNRIEHELDYALANRTAAVMHAHVPLASVSISQLDCVLELAAEKHIELVTFTDLEASSRPRAALALAFDDDAIDAWYAVRGLFRARGARVTFFVTKYATWSEAQRAKLAELAALGHDVQAHGVNHENALAYVAEHGVEQYVAQEVLPSVEMLEADGYAINTFAYPGGATNDEINDAVLEHLVRVRVTRSACPYY